MTFVKQTTQSTQFTRFTIIQLVSNYMVNDTQQKTDNHNITNHHD